MIATDLQYKNLEKIFSIEEVDDNQVIVKVNAKDPLTVAKYPFVQGNYAYITVTRGENHILTVVHDNGSTFDFHWGKDGYTMISESTKLLKDAVTQFIEDNDILIDYNGFKITNAVIYQNGIYWQLTLRGSKNNRMYNAYYHNKDAEDALEMIDYCKKFINAVEWTKGIAQTGITVWTAQAPITRVLK